MTLNVNNYFTYFKWTVLTRCSTFIFSLLEYALTTGQWFKIFKILLRLGKQKTDFLGSHTLGRFTCRGMTTRRVSFGGFFIDSSGYNTLGRLTRQGIILTRRAIIPPVILTRPEIIPRGDWKIGITCEFLTKSKIFLPIGLWPRKVQIMRKKWKSKIPFWAVPLSYCLFHF